MKIFNFHNQIVNKILMPKFVVSVPSGKGTKNKLRKLIR